MISSFVADSASQIVTFDGPAQDVLSGFQLRTTAVPEPSTAALLGLAFLGLVARRRRG